jgi:putative transposase
LAVGGTFFVTASTYRREHFFRGADRLDVLQRGLLTLTAAQGWHLEAWAIFSNHFHFVAHSPAQNGSAEGLSTMLQHLQSQTARWVNQLDGESSRQVWFNFWETRLTFPKSYLARLNYTHQNPVKHGLVTVANQYPWCSAPWFERTAKPNQVRKVYSLKIDRIQVLDDFDPV